MEEEVGNWSMAAAGAATSPPLITYPRQDRDQAAVSQLAFRWRAAGAPRGNPPLRAPLAPPL